MDTERIITKTCADIAEMAGNADLKNLDVTTSKIHVRLVKLSVFLERYFDDPTAAAPDFYWWLDVGKDWRNLVRFAWPICDLRNGRIVSFHPYEGQFEYQCDERQLGENALSNYKHTFAKLKDDMSSWIDALHAVNPSPGHMPDESDELQRIPNELTHDTQDRSELDLQIIGTALSRGEKSVDFNGNSKALKLVSLLINAGTKGLPKSKLIEIMWPKQAVTENNLDQQKSKANAFLTALRYEIRTDPDDRHWKIFDTTPSLAK